MKEQTVMAVDRGNGSRRPVVELALLGVIIVIVAGVSLGVTWQVRRIRSDRARSAAAAASAIRDRPAELPQPLPNFALIDQDGNPVTLDDFAGQVWVANFFFTSCPVQCPQMNMKMRQIHRALPEGAAAKLVSITVDPEKDSPEVLADYAQSFRAQDNRWLFLTGDKQAIIDLARNGFKLAAADDPNVHSLRLVLVDGSGRIRGYFDSTDDESMIRLQIEIRALLKEQQS